MKKPVARPTTTKVENIFGAKFFIGQLLLNSTFSISEFCYFLVKKTTKVGFMQRGVAQILWFLNYAADCCVIKERFIQQLAGVNFDCKPFKSVRKLWTNYFLKSNILRNMKFRAQTVQISCAVKMNNFIQQCCLAYATMHCVNWKVGFMQAVPAQIRDIIKHIDYSLHSCCYKIGYKRLEFMSKTKSFSIKRDRNMIICICKQRKNYS